MKRLSQTAPLLLSLAMMAVASLFTSCDREDNPTPPANDLKIAPEVLQVEEGATLQLTLNQNGKAVVAEKWEVVDPTIAEVSAEGLLKGLKAGVSQVKATYQNSTVEANLTVTAKEWGPETYVLPYFRFFDGKDAIIAYELGRGHTLEADDPSLGFLQFKTRSELMPTIKYMIGRAIEIPASAETLQSKEFLAFMKENGFNTTGQVESYGMMLFTTDKYKTVNPASIISLEGYAPGMLFTLKAPTMPKWEKPYLNFEGGEKEIASFEQARNFTLRTTREKGDYKEIIYGILTPGEEYDELHLAKYLFIKGKLSKVTHMVSPNTYVLESMGDGFNVTADFEQKIKSAGYTQQRITDNGKNYVVYTLAGQHKFTIEQWSMKIGTKIYPTAGIAYVPLNGPDKVETPEF